MSVTALLLAAGKGTRLRSALPKVLHPLAGRPMILYVLEAARAAGADEALVIVGHESEQVRRLVETGEADALFPVRTVLQNPQLGTGHAIALALQALDPEQESRTTLILSGDTPLITAETLRELCALHEQGGAELTLLSAVCEAPTGYGRVLRDAQGHAYEIKEEKWLSPEGRLIDEVNCGVYCARTAWLREAVSGLLVHPDGEYYLPDILPLAVAAGGISVLQTSLLEETRGINTRVHLAEAEKTMRGRINRRHMLAGVTLVDPERSYIEPEVQIGTDTTVLPGTHLRGKTRIRRNCTIGPDTEIVDSSVEEGARITRSVVEGTRVGAGCTIGPFAHLRPGTILAEGVEIGNYAEVKNSTLGIGTKSHHMSYLGDATIGRHVNVGAGTVTCNYDGTRKHHTTIGDTVFVGSDTMLRAPVTLGDGSATGAGSVVTHDVAPGALVAGVPAREMGTRKTGSETGEL